MLNTLTVLAHAGHSHVSGFEAGFLHPWLGLDHLLAMLAVGLLAVRAGSARAWWMVPTGFIGGMLVGAVVSGMGVGIPGVEWVIAGSVIALGLLVAALPSVSIGVALPLVAFAGMFHGHAHISEMAGSAIPYATGMVLATAILHALGIAAGLGLMRIAPQPAVRFAGVAMACAFAITLTA